MEAVLVQLKDLCEKNNWRVVWNPAESTFLVLKRENNKFVLNMSAGQYPPGHECNSVDYWNMVSVLLKALPELYKASQC